MSHKGKFASCLDRSGVDPELPRRELTAGVEGRKVRLALRQLSTPRILRKRRCRHGDSHAGCAAALAARRYVAMSAKAWADRSNAGKKEGQCHIGSG
jgi:hypothetical protein